MTSQSLADKTCVPCRGGVPPLTGDALQALRRQLPGGWLLEREHHLEKEFQFKNFAQALAFANRVGELAEEQNHHPDLLVSWGKTVVRIWTHKIDGLTESDFVFAAKTQRLFTPSTALAAAVKFQSKAAEAVTELLLQSLDDFCAYFRQIPENKLNEVFDTVDADCATALKNGAHVVYAALGHVSWALKTAGLESPPAEHPLLQALRAKQINLDTREHILDTATQLKPILAEALAKLPDEKLSIHGQTAWGETICVETMLEHAALHPLRHRRQLRTRLWNEN